MFLISDDDKNDEFSDFDDVIADKDNIPSEADISQSLQDANVDIDVASLETTEVDEITEPVSIVSRKRNSNPRKRKKISDQILIEKVKNTQTVRAMKKQLESLRHKTVAPAVISITKISLKLIGF